MFLQQLALVNMAIFFVIVYTQDMLTMQILAFPALI